MPNINLIRRRKTANIQGAPTNPAIGESWMDIDNLKIYLWDGDSWIDVTDDDIDMDAFDHDKAYDRAMSIL